MHQTIWNSHQKPVKGAWGRVTASIDWCEENYAITKYIAEFYNTISNIFIICFGFFGCYHLKQQLYIPSKYAYAMLGLPLVGFGSLGFHMTLKYDWQLLDELPMIYTSSIMTYLLFDAAPANAPVTFARRLLPYAIILFDIIFTLAYLYYPDPVFHQVIYAFIQASTTIRGLYLTYVNPTGSPQAKKLNQISWNMQWLGSAIFLLGFLIWNIDNLFCDKITVCKHYLDHIFPQLGAILEGHAWWHFFTGLGAYYVATALVLECLIVMYNVKGYLQYLDTISINYRMYILPVINTHPVVTSAKSS